MQQYFKKGERVLVGGNKYFVRAIIMHPDGGIHYALRGHTDIIPQDRVKKYYVPGSAKFCLSWKKAFIK